MNANLLSVVTAAAIVVGAISLVVLTFAVVRFFLELQAMSDRASAAIDRRITPFSERAKGISDNVEFITRAVRTDVERLNKSVKALSSRLQHASDRMEERIEEFNALMEVVQSEAEDAFLDTAATVRGVRAGARAIGRPAKSRPSGSAPENSREIGATAPAAGGSEEGGEGEGGARRNEHATSVTPEA